MESELAIARLSPHPPPVIQIWRISNILRAGGPEVLEVREAPDPAPGAGEVRIHVHASGMNFADISARIGLYPDMPKTPCVVGYEVAGLVDAVGVLLKTYLELPRFRPFDLMDTHRGVFGVNLGHLGEMEDALQGILGEIIAKVADGTFTPTVDKVFRFDEVRAAHLYIEERRNFGKVVLIP